jgi:hypothetical protein
LNCSRRIDRRLRDGEGLDLSYLDPPPPPAPVIVVKDVGGLVRDYQTQTDYYRQTNREVRVHECHSACTLALSLPNVCVYPDSIFKFHQAYNEITRQTDLGVSEQLYDAYPAAVRARLGPLTRQFKIMRGTELIALGVRDCNTPRTIVASSQPVRSNSSPAPTPASNPSLGAVWSDMMSAFGAKATAPTVPRPKTTLVATRQSTEAERSRTASLTDAAPPPHPSSQTPSETSGQMTKATTPETAAADVAHTPADVPLPPTRPKELAMTLTASLTQTMPDRILPPVMAGAQPILPPHFLAYAMIARAGSNQ